MLYYILMAVSLHRVTTVLQIETEHSKLRCTAVILSTLMIRQRMLLLRVIELPVLRMKVSLSLLCVLMVFLLL